MVDPIVHAAMNGKNDNHDSKQSSGKNGKLEDAHHTADSGFGYARFRELDIIDLFEFGTGFSIGEFVDALIRTS